MRQIIWQLRLISDRLRSRAHSADGFSGEWSGFERSDDGESQRGAARHCTGSTLMAVGPGSPLDADALVWAPPPLVTVVYFSHEGPHKDAARRVQPSRQSPSYIYTQLPPTLSGTGRQQPHQGPAATSSGWPRRHVAATAGWWGWTKGARLAGRARMPSKRPALAAAVAATTTQVSAHAPVATALAVCIEREGGEGVRDGVLPTHQWCGLARPWTPRRVRYER